MTLHAYWKTRVWDWRMRSVDELSYERLRLAWLSYVELINYGRGGQAANFQCDSCGPQPDTVIFDGITLGLQRRYIRKASGGDPTNTKLNGSRLGQSLLCIHFMT